MEFIDLKSQYSTLRETINVRIQRMVDALIAKPC
jgi:hypothetical protein